MEKKLWHTEFRENGLFMRNKLYKLKHLQNIVREYLIQQIYSIHLAILYFSKNMY